MKFLKEFKDFALKGNVLDLAIGVIIGAAFGKIVSSLVNDIIMPLFGWIFGGINFENLKYVIKEATDTQPESAIYYGNFIMTVVDFLLIAFSIFMFIKLISKANEKLLRKKKAQEQAAPPAPAPTSEQLLAEIRDLLKQKK